MIPVILSGGSGTRLWPLSRQQYPKQFLPVVGEETLFCSTLARLKGMPGLQAPIVVCNESHRFLVAEQLRQSEAEHQGILLEPCARNTAPAIALAALHAQQQDERAILLVLPADHMIAEVGVFQAVVQQSVAQTQAGKLITFGIVPERAETAYGYIRKGEVLSGGGHAVAAFVEKPDALTAEQYLNSGDYVWNSGMFMFRADVFLAELERLQPAVLAACRQALAQQQSDLDFIRLDEEAFASGPNISIDYAVMEHTQKAVVMSFQAGWSDVGAWDAVWRAGRADAKDNVIRGDVQLHAANGNLVYGGKRLISLLGVDDLVIVDTDDALLIAHREQAQAIKVVVDQLKQLKRPEASMHRAVHRPWGNYDSIDVGPRFQVKRIRVKPGASLSRQRHFHRAEHWVVVTGTAEVSCGDDVFLLHENQSTYIPVGVVHRLANPGKVTLELIEVQSGSYLGEDDIVRLADDYGRESGEGR